MGTKDDRQDYRESFWKEADKKGLKSMAGAVGMPDEGDWQNICQAIELFRKESVKKYGFDQLVDCIANARNEHANNNGGKYSNVYDSTNIASKDSNLDYRFELPQELMFMIEKAYPTMFRDKAHFRWFSKKFATLSITGRYN